MSENKRRRMEEPYYVHSDNNTVQFKISSEESPAVSNNAELQNQIYNVQQPVILNQYPILQSCLTEGGHQPTVIQTQNEQKLVYLIVPSENNQTENIQLKDVQSVPTLLVLPKELQSNDNEVQYVIHTSEASNDHISFENNTQESHEGEEETNTNFYRNVEKVSTASEAETASVSNYRYVYTQPHSNQKVQERAVAKNLLTPQERTDYKTDAQKKSYTYRNQYRCEFPDCGELFSSVYEKKSHAEVHLFPASSEFKCSICNQKFSKAADRNKHIDSHSIAETFKCKSCQKTFSYYTALVKHIDEQKCSTGKPLCCHFCGAKFLNQKDLDKHQKVNIKMCVCKTKVCGEPAFILHTGTCNMYLQKRNKLKS